MSLAYHHLYHQFRPSSCSGSSISVYTWIGGDTSDANLVILRSNESSREDCTVAVWQEVRLSMQYAKNWQQVELVEMQLNYSHDIFISNLERRNLHWPLSGSDARCLVSRRFSAGSRRISRRIRTKRTTKKMEIRQDSVVDVQVLARVLWEKVRRISRRTARCSPECRYSLTCRRSSVETVPRPVTVVTGLYARVQFHPQDCCHRQLMSQTRTGTKMWIRTRRKWTELLIVSSQHLFVRNN